MPFKKLSLAALMLLLQDHSHAELLANKSALQAAFTYNFASYTEWPSITGNRFNVCTWNAPLVAAALQELPPRRLKNLPVQYLAAQKIAELKSCQVVYVGEDAHGDLPAIHNALGEQAMLIVTDEESDELPPHASIILHEQNHRLAFSINRSAAQAAHLKISAELLSLAKKIY
ncbi:MAG: YfiR family protein [Sideroxydans sp.]|nr:YfiR family protein [Sideroxydans sp.]